MFDVYNNPKQPEAIPPVLPLERIPAGWSADFRAIGHQDGVTIENPTNVPIISADHITGLQIQARQVAYIHSPAFASSFDVEFVASCDGDWYFRGPAPRGSNSNYKFNLYVRPAFGSVQFQSNESGSTAARWAYNYPVNAMKKPTWVRIIADKFASGWRVATGIQPEGEARIWKIYYTPIDDPWVSGNDHLFFYTFFNYASASQCPPFKLQYWKVRLR